MDKYAGYTDGRMSLLAAAYKLYYFRVILVQWRVVRCNKLCTIRCGVAQCLRDPSSARMVHLQREGKTSETLT